MGSLRETDGRFVLDTRAAHALTIPVLQSGALLPTTGSAVALLAPDRARFFSGLLKIWSSRRCALLVPSDKILARFPNPPPRLDFDSSPPPLETVSWAPAEQVCSVLTSGSSGAPQLFSKNARQLFSEALTLADVLALDSNDTVLATTATHHVYGLLFGALAPWAANANIVADPLNEPGAFHPQNIASLVRAHRVTRLVTVPAHLRALLEADLDLSPLRQVISSAAPLDPEVCRRFENKYEIEVTDVLGSTETGGIALRRPAQSVAWSPLRGVSLSLNDEQRLVIHSPFLDNPEVPMLSDERARLHKDGSFEYLGRSDGVVKVGGKRISLREIEELTRSVPGVSDAHALSRPVSSLRGEEVLLIVAGKSLDKAAVKNTLRSQLEAVFVPRRIRIVESLPTDERGKVKRSAALCLFDERPMFERKFTLAKESPRFEGHFPSDPLLPALAQLSDLILPTIRSAYGGGALQQLHRVKWTHPLRPGDEVTLRLRPKKTGILFELFVSDTLSCSGTALLERRDG